MSSEVQIAVIDQQDTQIVLAVPGVQGATGSNIPTGGTANQVLRKASSTNYDTDWSLVTNAMVDSSAAIAGTKISPNFGSQNVVTTGTSTAASFIPTSSSVPTNGVYLPSANNVAISTNGTGRLFVDASGNVGIGAAPDGQLSLLGANSNTPRLRIQHPSNDKDAAISTFFDGGGTYLLTGSNHYLSSTGSNTKFDATSGSSAWYLDGSGLGIFYNSSGSGSITERLRIRADGTFEVKGGGTAGTSPAVSVNPSASANSLVIDSSGRVGLGTSSPSVLLHLAGSAAQNARIDRTGSIAAAGENYGSIEFVGRNSTGSAPPDYSARIVAAHDSAQTASTRASSLSFFTQFSSSNASEKMRIDSQGRVGIGTTSVETLLHLRSDSASAVDHLFLQNATGGAGSESRIAFSASTAGYSANRFSYIGVTLTGAGQNGHNLVFATNANGGAASEKARLTSDGKLLVGTSSQSGGSLLQVNDNRIRIATAKTPASATDTGVAGEICWDANYVYVCTATNTWKRTAISTW